MTPTFHVWLKKSRTECKVWGQMKLGLQREFESTERGVLSMVVEMPSPSIQGRLLCQNHSGVVTIRGQRVVVGLHVRAGA